MELITLFPKIKLIVGLGNIGREYAKTRHNVGFMFVDFLHSQFGSSAFSDQTKFKAMTSEIQVAEQKILLAKPTTMMNSSGESVALLKAYFKLNNDEILIVHDDMDIRLGEYKIQLGKGPKVHNGLSSIDQMLSSPEYYRLRIGIENREILGNKGMPGRAYALSNFSEQEEEIIKTLFAKLLPS